VWTIAPAPVTDGFLRLRQREHLGVRGGVLEQLHLIERPTDDSPLAHDDRADGHFLRLEGARGLSQRLAHEVRVALQVNDRLVHAWKLAKTETSNNQHPTPNIQFPDAPVSPLDVRCWALDVGCSCKLVFSHGTTGQRRSGAMNQVSREIFREKIGSLFLF
jgi:hypothetical protein